MIEIVVCEPINIFDIERKIQEGRGSETIKTKTYVFSDQEAIKYMRTHTDDIGDQIRIALERQGYNIE